MALAAKLLTRLVLMMFGLILAGIVIEIGLRVYNPFETRVLADRVLLPANKTYTYTNNDNPKLDSQVIHTKNSLGFRGDSPPVNFERALTILTVGGSTTESTWVSDSKTWPDHLGRLLGESFKDLWVNNAGFDGHSTFGHQVLLEDHIAKFPPDIIIYLIGLNDMGREIPNNADQQIVRGLSIDSVRIFLKSTANYSKLSALILNARRSWLAREMGVSHANVDYESYGVLTLSNAKIELLLEKHRTRFIPSYQTRLRRLIETTLELGIVPILVTQTAAAGDIIDPTTGVDISSVKLSDEVNGAAWGQVIREYNQATLAVAADMNLLAIDMASLFPADTAYYYDFVHFANLGSKAFGGLMARELCPWLAEYFAEHVQKECII